MSATLRIAILPDFREEGWMSMEYSAELLTRKLPGAVRLSPPYKRLASRFSNSRFAINFDRYRNRFRNYPRFIKTIAGQYDRYHVVDHSYAHLVHGLPARHSGVLCHDIDAFLSVVDPVNNPRPNWFQSMSRKLLTGLQKAAIVFHISHHTRNQLLQFGMVDPSRLVYAPLGVAEEFTPDSTLPSPAWLDSLKGTPWILHVGSCIPRKRIDILLVSFAEARRRVPELKLVKIGGDFTATHHALIDSRGLNDVIIHRKNLTRAELGAVYRAAPLVVMPSDSEGLGLPALEALACGSPVLASDIPALREAGGTAAVYLPAGDVDAWAASMASAIASPGSLPPRAERLAHASHSTWENHARIIASAYEALT